MGKKIKVGKARRDKFYQLAKESGYRSRSAFKLIQLNRKFGFLQNCKVLIDLCAAPGGWMQVAREQMPLSSLVVGVDLVPIRDIAGCKSITADITTEACRQSLKKELHSWQADVILHDGAPNVGKAWLHDEFQQAQLAHQSFKLATDFLKRGGWFITKVFRSQDYDKLKFIFLQLFQQVKAVKPEASRQESAEIYLVCRNYKAPDKIDPAFFDTCRVFGELPMSSAEADLIAHNTLFKQGYRKAKPLGYKEGEAMFQRLPASEFLNSDSHLLLLAKASEIHIDLPEIENHKLTTNEIRECCKDIKVLGKSDIKLILNWRSKLLKRVESAQVISDETEKLESATAEDGNPAETEAAAVEEQLQKLQEEEHKELKKKIKKVREKKRQLRERIELKMVNPGDKIDQSDDVDLFSLVRLQGDLTSFKNLTESALPAVPEDTSEPSNKKKERVKFERDEMKPDYNDYTALDDSGGEEVNSDVDLDSLPSDASDDEQRDDEFCDEEDDDDDDHHGHKTRPLLQTLEKKDERKERITKDWFAQDLFKKTDVDEVVIKKAEAPKNAAKGNKAASQVKQPKEADAVKQPASAGKGNASGDAGGAIGLGKHKLTAEELAVGVRIIKSKKARRDIEEQCYNRYMWDEGTNGSLPTWFVEDEKRHMRRSVPPVSAAEVSAQQARFKQLNVRTIKKVAEAKARKKRKNEKRLEKARKKANVLVEDEALQERERWGQIKQVYKKAGLLGARKRRSVKLVVTKKGGGSAAAKKSSKGGSIKRVDARMKKDTRATPGRGGGGKGGRKMGSKAAKSSARKK